MKIKDFPSLENETKGVNKSHQDSIRVYIGGGGGLDETTSSILYSLVLLSWLFLRNGNETLLN